MLQAAIDLKEQTNAQL